MKLQYDETLSNFAFSFNLRRYTAVLLHIIEPQGRAVQVDPIKPVLKPPGTMRLKLKHGKLLSSFAFKSNLRRCTKDNPGVVTATVAVVRGETPTGRLHEGVASTYLARFVPYGDAAGKHKVNGVATAMLGVRVSLFVRTSTFKLPRDPATPVVMIGPGTGYAPFRVGTDA